MRDDGSTGEGIGPAEWGRRYALGDTPWDLGGPHPELSLRLQTGELAPRPGGARALVPGAGRGHDALALARRGWSVTAIDLHDVVDDHARAGIARHGGRVVEGDALEHVDNERYDLVWDHTFFCAIDPAVREAWGRMAAELVAPGGRYVALVFPSRKPAEEGGPPFGMESSHLASVLGPLFRVTEEVPVQRGVARRTWSERWLVMERARLDPGTRGADGSVLRD